MASSDITITFEGQDNVVSIIDAIVNGLSNLESSVDSAINYVDTLSESLNSIDGSSIDAVADSASDAETDINGLDSQVDNLESTLDSVDSSSIDEIAVASDSAEGSANSLSSSIDGLANSIEGINTGKIDDLGDSMDSLDKSNSSTTKSTNSLTSALGVLGVATSVASFADAIKSTDDMNVKMQTLAGATGLTTDEMNTLKKSAADALKGSGESAKQATVALMELELRSGTTKTTMQGLSGSLSEVYVQASRMGVSAESFATAWSKAFDTWDKGNEVSQRILKNLGLNKDQADKLSKTYKEFGKDSEQFKVAMKEIGDQANDTTSKTGGLQSAIGELQKIIGSVFNDIDKLVGPAATQIAEFIGNLDPMILSAIGIALISLGAGATIGSIGLLALQIAAAPIALSFSLIGAAIVAVVLGLIWAYENVQPFKEVVDALAKGLSDFYESTLKPLGEYLYGVFVEAWNQLSAAINIAWKDYIEPFISWLAASFGVGVDEAGGKIDWFKAIWDGLSAVVHWVIDSIIAYIQFLWTIISNIIGMVGDIIKGDWNSAFRRMGTIVDTAKEYIRDGIGKVPGYISAAASAVFSAAVDLGKNIMKGIIDALSGLGQAIKDKITGAVGGLVSFIGGLFGGGKKVSMVHSFNPYNNALKSYSALGAPLSVPSANISNDNRSATVVYNVDVKTQENITEEKLVNMLSNRRVIDQINIGLNMYR